MTDPDVKAAQEALADPERTSYSQVRGELGLDSRREDHCPNCRCLCGWCGRSIWECQGDCRKESNEAQTADPYSRLLRAGWIGPISG